MNPSFPFIAAPYDDFMKFRADLNSTAAVQNNNLTCSSLDWCYFKTSCDNVVGSLPNLTFYLGAGEQLAEFVMSPASYLFQEVNTKKNITNCHVAIIGQDFANVTHWILGDIFNYNFYTSFDAENTPKVGLAIQVGAATGQALVPQPQTPAEHTNVLMNVFVSLLVIVIFTLMLYVCCRFQAKAKHNAALRRVAEYEQRKRMEGVDDDEGEYVMSSGSGEHVDEKAEPMLTQERPAKVSFSLTLDSDGTTQPQ